MYALKDQYYLNLKNNHSLFPPHLRFHITPALSRAGWPQSLIHSEHKTCCAVALPFGLKANIDRSIALNALLSVSDTISRPA